jgi:cytochrome c nitrite reductase small subunit
MTVNALSVETTFPSVSVVTLALVGSSDFKETILVVSNRRLVPGVILGVAFGMTIGVGAYTFVYARGYSYMTDNAEACVNCHVMQDQFSGWLKSSHRAVAVCNDCHTPPGLVGKYATKAQNGFWHSYYFTTGWFEDNIHITPRGRAVTEQACRKCHQDSSCSITTSRTIARTKS